MDFFHYYAGPQKKRTYKNSARKKQLRGFS